MKTFVGVKMWWGHNYPACKVKELVFISSVGDEI